MAKGLVEAAMAEVMREHGPTFKKLAEHDSAQQATKFDADKIDMTYLPRAALEGISRAFMFGSKKYGRANYRQNGGMGWLRLGAAALRHLTAFLSGEDFDKESGLNHLYHLGACVMMLIDYFDNRIGTDDRTKGE